MSLSVIGGRIEERRKRLGLTQQEVADKTGVGRSRISAMENGRFTGRITDLLAVLSFLGLELDCREQSAPIFEDLDEVFADED